MDITRTILTFVLQSEEYATTEVNRKLGNTCKDYMGDKFNGCIISAGLSAYGYTRYKTTFIAFLNHGQEVTQGIYPVVLYYRKIRKLVFAYGVSATNASSIAWDWNKIQVAPPMLISEYFSNKRWKKQEDYQNSFVCACYDLEDFVDKYRDIDITKPEFNIAETGLAFDDDLNRLVQHFNIMFNAAFEQNSVMPVNTSIKELTVDGDGRIFSINAIIENISSTGLQYDPVLIKRFAFSLMTKPFVILSGLAGSGKTQLALTFAKTLIQDESQMCVVPVGADWTNREPLLGYPNALDSTKYQMPESGVLRFLMDANDNPNRPYFLILDEMNMSYVERYFADFLSAMESKESIKLWGGADGNEVPQTVNLSKNIYIIGTINVDETTYMFSPKVLDRANVIEFKISVDEMDAYLRNMTAVKSVRMGSGASMAKNFVKMSQPGEELDKRSDSDISAVLVDFFKELKSVNAEFGYRSANEIFRYIDIADNDDHAPKLTPDQILDSAIVQKLLPKLHGSRKKLESVLCVLWDRCGANCKLKDAVAVPEGAKYPLTADKVLRMYRSAIDNGFTSFSEA